MKKINYTVTAEAGIHARPAGLLVKKAASFKSNIKILHEQRGSEADLKRLMAVMALGVKQGDGIVLSVDGEDEEEAADALEAFLKENF
ncbi:MAG: HPr family phosphocarrier protein [Lachnospiraceae bacterium]|jgi:phosphocarrier,  HPr family|nr:HPr family phosphocarrier protein [Lachnospiraceae bacterium]MBF0998975.1 HPr family phosphocarrier protein [Lachnospiraceae bacterium]MBF1001032.1 HPr family phosphocarrier protein [Lachnospiraceae bacterium]MBF1017800.1 HPr family phosphocarrier protein [Lachnospiraceae bacterium]